MSSFQFGCPLNQKSAPAASLAPATGAAASGAWNGAGFAPFAGKITLWRPAILKATLPPAFTLTVLG
jgi:hypothetical protein